MDPNKDNKGNPLRKYLALTGIAFEMGAIIFAFSYIGGKLDTYYNTTKEWFTIAFVLLGVICSLFLVLKQLKRINKQND
ncbi:AtpZ/AtpI family protein [Aquimarina sp. ERC-38]|uniref:AtpZ/AtpI family protein n=1 Tax=Aquimarina sp. ERC-38 TaxID=2949996 RepID=UPI002245C0E0|nr:AtpZ/AtpI family protein [Aquimarina sp. ERC-38]UZO81898.1 AtpZ/AtpI family protein [Aquimarina sp. ERC-38]